MDAKEVVCKALKIPYAYINESWSCRSDRTVILIQQGWLNQLFSNAAVPDFMCHPTLTSEEIQAALRLNQPFPSPWHRVMVQIIPKRGDTQIAINIMRPRNCQTDLALLYPQLLHYVSHTNYKNLWKQQFKKYLGDGSRKRKEKKLSARGVDTVLRDVLGRFHGSPVINLSENSVTMGNSKFEPHVNVLPLQAVIETDETFILLFPMKSTTTLKDLVTFSPTVFSTDVNKPLFLAYQLLQVLRDTHDRSLLLGEIRMDDIIVSDDLFMQIIPDVLSNIFPITCDQVLQQSVPRSPIDESLAAVSRRWVHGDVSNFDYLMHLNAIAGRRYGNPSCHFVLPWVSDLSSGSNGAWRDLTKSKFRLNKGDRQLDLTYEQASSTQAPHHVTDVLSEITYYVYLARRTPVSVLCKYVRPQWVPAEYPISIHRLYMWTPDECVPEFYTDPSIFKSIHEDLGDMELPPWASTPEQFISAHRELLESRRVSEKLHHWIDLTFGYKLSGLPAIKAKNVCLRLANGQQELSTSGVVQVFSHPHPRKQSPLPHFDKQPPKLHKTSPRTEEGNSSEGEDDTKEAKQSPLMMNRFLSISRTSLLTPFQSSDEGGPKISAASSARSASRPDNHLLLLESVENAFAFHMKTFGDKPGEDFSEAAGVRVKQAVAAKRIQEMQNIGCLLIEIFRNSQTRLKQFSSMESRVAACRLQLTNENVPHCFRPALRLLLDSYPPITDVGLPPPSPHQMLQKLLTSYIIPFPPSMPQLYSVVAKLKMFEGSPLRAKILADEIPHVSEKVMELLVPYVQNLLEDPETTEIAITTLLDPILAALGIERSNKLFVDPLVSLYGREAPLLCLYERRFLLTLIVRLGLKTFLHVFVVLIVEAVGRVSELGHVCDEEESSPETEERRPITEPCAEIGMFAFDREDTPSDGDSILHVMEQLTGTSDDEADISTGSESLNVLRSPPIPMKPLDRVMTIECEVGSKNSDGITDPQPSDFDELSSMQWKQNDVIHDVAADSIIWLSRRLGPVLTAKHITRNLLKMLTLCYTGSTALSAVNFEMENLKGSVSKHRLLGDDNCANVCECLKQLVELYGEQLILVQYLPFMTDLVALSKRKMTYSVEGGVVGALTLLRIVTPLLSDATLMDNLQDVILNDIIHPMVRLMVSSRFPFPSGASGRLALATKLLDTLYFLAVHIGADMTRAHLAVPSLQRFFLAFDRAAGLRLEIDEAEGRGSNDDLRRVFGPALAHSAYSAFLQLLGDTAMKNAVVNHELVKRLCLMHEKQTFEAEARSRGANSDHFLTDFFTSSSHEEYSGSFGRSSALVGNKIEIEDKKEGPVSVTESLTFKDCSRHIRGNWLAYWEHEIGRSDKDTRFNFKQIKLQSFSGHSHAVRCLEVLNNENSLVSGSRDKTVKLWSLRNQGDGSTVSPCQFTYTGHSKSLVGLAYLPQMRLVASCDSVLHLWDPLTGSNISTVEGKSACSVLKALDTTLYMGTSDATLRVVDARTPLNYADFKVCWSQGGLVRCLAVSGEGGWVALGQNSGYITVLDLRTKLVMAYWKAHEGEVLQLVAIDKTTLLSSSIDQPALSAWNISDGKLKYHLKGPTEPVHCLRTHGPELISATTANRIGVHTAMDSNAGFSSTKLRSDTFKGVVTAMTALPLNKQLLLAADNGGITLLC